MTPWAPRQLSGTAPRRHAGFLSGIKSLFGGSQASGRAYPSADDDDSSRVGPGVEGGAAAGATMLERQRRLEAEALAERGETGGDEDQHSRAEFSTSLFQLGMVQSKKLDINEVSADAQPMHRQPMRPLAVLCCVWWAAKAAVRRSSVPASSPPPPDSGACMHVMPCSLGGGGGGGQEGVRTVRGNEAWQLTADARRSLPASPSRQDLGRARHRAAAETMGEQAKSQPTSVSCSAADDDPTRPAHRSRPSWLLRVRGAGHTQRRGGVRAAAGREGGGGGGGG